MVLRERDIGAISTRPQGGVGWAVAYLDSLLSRPSHGVGKYQVRFGWRPGKPGPLRRPPTRRYATTPTSCPPTGQLYCFYHCLLFQWFGQETEIRVAYLRSAFTRAASILILILLLFLRRAAVRFSGLFSSGLCCSGLFR